MTLDALKASFAASLAEKIIYIPVSRQPKRPRRDNSYKHILYPIQQLSALIDVLKTKDEENEDCKYSVRYLVTEEKKLVFALEGLPNFSIPEHRQMRGSCLAAGNVYFSSDFKSITKINHCSGDFHPSAGSLIWPIAALHLLQASVALPFVIEISSVNHLGIFTVEASHSLELKQIDELLSAEIKTDILSANADPMSEIIEYKDPSAPIERTRTKHRSLFFTSLPKENMVLAQESAAAGCFN